MLVKQKKAVTLRLPVIPGITDQEKNIEEILQFILNLDQGGIARHKYKKLNKEYLMGDTDVPSADTMNRLKNKLELAGLKVYIGG
jgi:pyruvate formate lyase activating enzyme